MDFYYYLRLLHKSPRWQCLSLLTRATALFNVSAFREESIRFVASCCGNLTLLQLIFMILHFFSGLEFDCPSLIRSAELMVRTSSVNVPYSTCRLAVTLNQRFWCPQIWGLVLPIFVICARMQRLLQKTLQICNRVSTCNMSTGNTHWKFHSHNQKHFVNPRDI